MIFAKYSGKVTAVPLQTWIGPEGSRKLRCPDFMTTAQGSGKDVSLTHRLPLTPLVLLVTVGWRQGRTLSSEEDKMFGKGLFGWE